MWQADSGVAQGAEHVGRKRHIMGWYSMLGRGGGRGAGGDGEFGEFGDGHHLGAVITKPFRSAASSLGRGQLRQRWQRWQRGARSPLIGSAGSLRTFTLVFTTSTQ